MVTKENIPPLWHLYLLNAVVAKVQVALLDETESNATESSLTVVPSATYVQDLLPYVIRLTQTILHCTR